MISYSSIAVGTDGSESSLAAVKAAASLARVYDSQLIIMCAWSDPSGSFLGNTHSDVSATPVVSEEMAEQHLADAAEVAKYEGAENVELRKITGAPAAAMVEAVAAEGIELIVVGNRGINTLPGRVFGNIPTEVLRNATVNVLIVNTAESN